MTKSHIRKPCPRFPTRLLVAASLLSAVATGAACQGGRARAPASAGSAQWTKDSAGYIQDSAKWVRDSIVIDSISRAINTDSLYHLERAQLRAENPVPFQRAIDCEMARLSWGHGANATHDAFQRMVDTLFQPSDEAERKRVSNRLSGMSVEEMTSLGVGERQCGKFSRWGPRHPPDISGASLDTRTGRPAKPQRPGR
jgi:hypothetical protein